MKAVCFGEIMGRLNPVGYQKLLQAEQLEISYAGGEANVAVSLANFGKEVSYVTKLPDNDLAKSAVRKLRSYGVQVSDIVTGGSRMGLYFVEKGASQRASGVLYDRAGSSIATASPEDFDWERIFAGADWFHFTGITPALSDTLSGICLQACRTAKSMGLTVSCDLNYRNKLWTTQKAGRVMASLMPYVDVAIGNEEDCEKVFGIRAAGSDITGGRLDRAGYEEVAKTLSQRYSVPTVAVTLRGSLSASDNTWAGMLYRDGACWFSKEYTVHLVDRVGGGDSFGGGLIYALNSGFAPQDAVEFAVAASCLKQTIEHDFNEVTADEVQKLMKGDGSGRVQR